MNPLKGTLALQGGEEVSSSYVVQLLISFSEQFWTG